jgi:hypothetical protein
MNVVTPRAISTCPAKIDVEGFAENGHGPPFVVRIRERVSAARGRVSRPALQDDPADYTCTQKRAANRFEQARSPKDGQQPKALHLVVPRLFLFGLTNETRRDLDVVAPRSMKMGTIASPCPYDAATRSDRQVRDTPRCCATRRGLPILQGGPGYLASRIVSSSKRNAWNNASVVR